MKRKVALLHIRQKMREEMDRVWKDFFEKNPHEKEEDLRRRVEERFRNLARIRRISTRKFDRPRSKPIKEEVEERI